MDKLIAKQLVQTAGMLTPKWQMYTNDQVLPDFPCVVKPNSNGSSIGVSIVDNQAAFDAAIQQIDTNSDTILIEEKIEGREFSIGVLDNQALPVIEIIPKAGFYDYENKYQPDATEEIVPAHLSAAVTAKLQTMAVDAHQILGLGYYSRIDVMMDRNENLYFIEANSLPGMTPTSLLPQEAAAAGISYEALCELLIQHADYQA